MSDANRIAEIDGMLNHLNLNPDSYNKDQIWKTLMTERANLAYTRDCASGAIAATAAAFRADEPAKLTIQQVCAQVRQLLADCDGDSSINLQECLEALEKDRKAIEVI